ncbi:MAG: helix-turn-helix transcriptional regulator [Saprospiraceae bacterium]|nr:helix-turn-helix transcriptional regulator [Saprospiraceae bacterium]
MELKFRCDCPITSAIDILGDKWMLVIIKQMLVQGKETFKDFMACDEGIATNILTAKLKQLEAAGLVVKSKLPTNKKSVYYHLTDKGLSLAPVIVELVLWSDSQVRPYHPMMQNIEALEMMRSDKEAFIKGMIERYQKKIAATKISDS